MTYQVVAQIQLTDMSFEETQAFVLAVVAAIPAASFTDMATTLKTKDVEPRTFDMNAVVNLTNMSYAQIEEVLTAALGTIPDTALVNANIAITSEAGETVHVSGSSKVEIAASMQRARSAAA